MRWTQLFKFLKALSLKRRKSNDESGIAIFMVMSAIAIITLVVSEFTYVAKINAQMAFDSTDQIKAHYLAKTGLKLSLLRLRAYKELKAFGGDKSPLPKIPKAILDQVWSFPFVYPLPKDLPGMLPGARDRIEEFEKESSLSGEFSALIEPESDRINLNSIIAGFAPQVSASPPPSSSNSSKTPQPQDSNKKKDTPKYSVEASREGLKKIITEILKKKFEDDSGFANEYRDFQVDELMDNILGWVDYTYQPRNSSGRQMIPYKRAPFYDISELRMIYPIDDGLYDVLAPNFTTILTNGFNVNKMQEPLLRAIFPLATDQEVTEFFEFRDSVEEDNTFQSVDDFWKYVEKSFQAYRSSDDLKKQLTEQGIQFITDEETFRITVRAKVNQASRTLVAWVSLAETKKEEKTTSSSQSTENEEETPSNESNATQGTDKNSTPATGLRILFMREF